ncbi:RES domain-containing protein [Cedecea colo]|uniref:RES domain-containing protein n=1 Tax=Cedecea colo TaxID=2552946 RepID=A0ABX0VNZ9_9ENTR|nr:RES domain-containing protein [Cedecea colo]NIY48807.1 RES domain-containing protein [Cedecea colo]
MDEKCCPECFNDNGLRRSIIPSLEPIKGTCSYCKSENVDIIEPSKLAIFFEMLINVYEPNEDGKGLVEWMRDDWGLFTHHHMDNAHAKELLSEILDDGEIVRKNYIPSSAYKSEALAQWDTLKDELLYKNRYFLDQQFDTERLTELLGHLKAYEIPEEWFRARIMLSDKSYDIAEMGAPPKRLASHGRANPTGIPYLYLGSFPETAIAEIRPHTGEKATVAKFKIPEGLIAIDLRNPREHVSPFLLSDASEIGKMRSDIPFLERLGEELTRPVLPRSAAIDYIPSQYLCEFIKKKGFQGVIYRSSVSHGINLALFDPTQGKPISITQYNVNCVSVEVSLG